MARMAFSEKIRMMRKDRGFKQEELAGKCDVSPDTVSTWERGIKIPELDNLITLSNVFGCSLDVFRPDALSLDLPRPDWSDYPNGKSDDTCDENNVPLRFGSTEPDEKQQKILDFCGTFLDGLDAEYFVKGAGQNSEYGTGRYFWENKIDYLMFIGVTPTLQGDNAKYAYSVCVNTETPLGDDILAKYDCLQVTNGDEENWIYVPIEVCEADGQRMLQNAKKSLKTAIDISREALRIMTDKVFGSLNEN